MRKMFRIDILVQHSNHLVFIYGVHDFVPKIFETKEECFDWISQYGGKYEYVITEIYSNL